MILLINKQEAEQLQATAAVSTVVTDIVLKVRKKDFFTTKFVNLVNFPSK